MKRPPFKNPHDLLAVGGTIKRPPFKNPHSLLAVGIFLNSDILIRKAAVHLCELRQLIYTVPAPCSPDIDHCDLVLREDLLALYGISVHVCRFELKSLADQARPGEDRGEELGIFQDLNKVIVKSMIFFYIFRLDIGRIVVEELGRIENIVCHVIYFADFRKLLLFEVVKIRAILL